ncbi:MAG: AsmA family protein, partial [Pseudomonadota bacterium]|nr:AsmA family protein [Pseudomonadota bacterium]
STAQDFRFAAVSLSGLASRPGNNQPTQWQMSAPTIDLSLKNQTVAAPSFALRYSGAQLNGKFAGTKILDDLSITGSVVLAPLVLREFMPRFGMAIPRTRDPHALSQLAVSSDFAYDVKGVSLDKIQMQLDDTKLRGNLALITGDSRMLKFEFVVDHIDADRYRSPEANPPESAAKAAKTSGTAAKPAAASTPFEAQGTLSVASLRFSKMDFTAMRLTAALKNNVLHLFPTQAMIDGGHYSGDITLDSRGAVPTLSLDEHLNGIDVSQLLSQSAAKNRVSGHGNVNLNATAEGTEAAAILKSLDGHFDANLVDGAVEGVDLGYEMGIAQALLDHKPAPPQANTKRTKFEAFKMSAQINNGVATTKDLTISSAVLRVTGQGSANLSNQAIDFQVLATILKSPTATVADIPMKITGTYSAPTVRPDLEALAKGQLRQKLQDVLQDKLKGLFGK